ncbi:MAG: hypothetical protein NW241_12555 [Bacteroidia bacterium]|nr:hypothetical protein [Bacteroidia bacterium]
MSAKKQLTIETSRKKFYFYVTESSGKFRVQQVDSFGWISDDTHTVGTARTLQDAIELAKSCVEGSVRNIDIH